MCILWFSLLNECFFCFSVIVPGHTNEAQVQKLSPATTYNIRIVAENEIGVSDNSEVVTIITAEEGKLI
jgi:hypothetical protein